jgi:hypothetical protein
MSFLAPGAQQLMSLEHLVLSAQLHGGFFATTARSFARVVIATDPNTTTKIEKKSRIDLFIISSF